MSASAPALAKEARHVVAMRLADPAATLAYVSLIFGVLLIFFPVSFPRLLVQSWLDGRLTPIMILFTVCLNVGLYLSVAYQRSARPGMLAAGCLGSVPVLLLAGLNLILHVSISHTLSENTPNALARVDEEILAHTYFALIAAIFAPFLLIRLAQQFSHRNQ